MERDVDLGEIVFCNLTIHHSGKSIRLTGVVYKNTGGFYDRRSELKRFGISTPVKVLEVEVISRLGFENKSTDFSEVKVSDEKRNKTTGAYE